MILRIFRPFLCVDGPYKYFYAYIWEALVFQLLPKSLIPDFFVVTSDQIFVLDISFWKALYQSGLTFVWLAWSDCNSDLVVPLFKITYLYPPDGAGTRDSKSYWSLINRLIQIFIGRGMQHQWQLKTGHFIFDATFT